MRLPLLLLLMVACTDTQPATDTIGPAGGRIDVEGAAVIIAPIAGQIAARGPLELETALLSVAYGCSCAFILPLSQWNLMVMGPGGYHVMLMGLNGPLVEGRAIEITLVFRDAGTMTVSVPVKSRDGYPSGHGGHDKGHHGATTGHDDPKKAHKHGS